jgi:hypothetical protein
VALRSARVTSVIVVLGRPALAAPRRPFASPDTADSPGHALPTGSILGPKATRPNLLGLAASVALEVARRGSRVELVGSIGDDPAGDEIVVELGHAGIGHAALLRDPGGATPVAGSTAAQLPRLDAADVELGLRYVADSRVLIVADPLSPEAEAAAIEGAAYHGATMIAVVSEGATISSELSAAATVLQEPRADRDAADPEDETASSGPSRPFASYVAALAILLDAGSPFAEAFPEAARSTGWEHASGG